jgi:serine protease Do
MIHFLRPYKYHTGFVALAALGAAAAIAPQAARAQATEITQVIQEPSPLLVISGSKGYLGVLVGDVDSDSAAKLKLKEVRGAVITVIDHDAPAGQMGLKVNDVVLELNGQQIEGAEQLRRMLHEIPPGRNVSMLVSRDGNTLTLATKMGDHKKIVEGFWTRIAKGSDIFPSIDPGNSLLGNGDVPSGSGIPFAFFGSTLKVGALVEPLTSQMAEYLGIPGGLMVKQVARKSEADAAGLKVFDVILKVGTDSISTTADWERSLRANAGKPVPLTILRDKKQQTLTLQVDSKHNKGELEMDGVFTEDCPEMADVDPDVEQMFALDSSAAADELRRQAEVLRDQLKAGGLDRFKPDQFKIDPQQAEALRKQAEKLRDSMKSFSIDRDQLDQLKQQMDQWRKSFNPDDFKIDQKQLDELKKQMDEWQKDFQPQDLQIDPQWL